MKVFRKAVAFVLALAVAVSLFSVSTSVFAAYKNQLIVDEVEHGSIKIAAPGDNVDDNATVRLWVFPDEGYQVGEWHVYYRSGGKTMPVQVTTDTVWLNRNQLAELFVRDVKTIGKHIGNALKEELDESEVVAKFATATRHGAIEEKEIMIDVIMNCIA